MKKVALIGYGSIAKLAFEKLAEHNQQGYVKVVGVLVQGFEVNETRTALDDSIAVVTAVEDLISLSPNIIVECAGQGAVAEYGEAILKAGIDFMVISTGALANDELRDRLTAICEQSGAKQLIPSGAVAGIDGIGAHNIGGLKKVRYTSTKPPLAWKGTPADENFNLSKISKRTVLFTGPARDVAQLYPKNANLAATVALAGLGMDQTEVELVADPEGTPHNVGRIYAEGEFGELIIECRNIPSPENPKTSATTALSIVYALLKDTHTLVI